MKLNTVKISSGSTWQFLLLFAVTAGLSVAGLEYVFGALLIAGFAAFMMGRTTNRELAFWLLLGFLLRTAVAYAAQYLSLFHYLWDDYYTTALLIKDNLVHGIPAFNNVQESVHGIIYPAVCALIYYVFGDYQILARIFNCFLGAMVADRVYSLTLKLTDNRQAALIAALFTLFFPSFIVFSTLDMRDAAIFYLTVDMLHRSSQIIISRRYRDYAFLALDIVGLYFLRTQYLILFTLIFLLYWLIRTIIVVHGFKRWFIITLILSITIGGYLVLERSDYFAYLFKEINADMEWRTAGGSAYLTGMSYDSWWDIIYLMPLRVIHFTFGPFLWNVNNIFMFVGAIESLVLVLLVAAAFSREASRLYLRHPQQYLLLMTFAMVGLFTSAIIDSNYGTAIRHKMNFIFIFFILGSTYLKDLRLRIK